MAHEFSCKHHALQSAVGCQQPPALPVDYLIGLVGAVDGLVQRQAKTDAYYVRVAGRDFDESQRQAIAATTLAAYRWQSITSGAQDPRFLELLGPMIDANQNRRGAVDARPAW